MIRLQQRCRTRCSIIAPLHTAWAAYFLIFAAAPTAHADIYTRTDKDGVVHFTNIDPSGRHWRRVMKTGPGKARVVHAIRTRHLPPDRYQRYDGMIRGASALYNIPVALIRAVIRTESSYDPRAVSRVGAAGMMQLMPATARGMGVTDVFDPHQNIYGGTRFLRILANRFRGDLTLTIAAYHAGPGNVIRYGRTVPPYATTQSYVSMVLARYEREAGQ